MQRFTLLACLLSICTLSAVTSSAQEPVSAEQTSCDALSRFVSQDVKNAATSLHVCQNLLRILNRRNVNSVTSYQKFTAELDVQPESSAVTFVAPDEETKQSDLQDRREITERVNRNTLDSNLILLRAHTAVLELQASGMNAEQRAYRRTKKLNAFLGTTVGAIGSGMQFSSNTSVQHAGDGVSVAGGAITAIFAICTAGVSELDNPPADPLADAFANNNQNRAFPATVWSYLILDPSFSKIVEAVPKPEKRAPKFLSCHWEGAPRSAKVSEELNFLNTLNDGLVRMSQATAEISRLSAQ